MSPPFKKFGAFPIGLVNNHKLRQSVKNSHTLQRKKINRELYSPLLQKVCLTMFNRQHTHIYTYIFNFVVIKLNINGNICMLICYNVE